MTRRSRGTRGFTMIELLSVIAIMGILAGIATLGVAQFRKSATNEACGADVDQVKVAASAYIAKNGIPIPGADSTARMTTLHDKDFLHAMPADPDAIDLDDSGKVDDNCG